MRPRWLRLSSLFFVFLPLVGALAIGWGVSNLVFQAKASVADGVVVKVDKVVDHRWTGSGDRARYVERTRYYPFVRFVTASEQVVQYSDGSGSNPPAYRVGDSVRVLYDPANPQKARLDTWSSGRSGSTVMIIIGVVIILSVGVVVFRWSFPERRGRGAQGPVRGRRRPPRPSPPRFGAEPNQPPHREPPGDRPQDSKVRDE